MARFLVESRAEDWGRVPERFGRPGDMRDVTEIVDRWPGEDHCYYRVLADDGSVYILRHDEGENSWRIHFFDNPASPHPAPQGEFARR